MPVSNLTDHLVQYGSGKTYKVGLNFISVICTGLRMAKMENIVFS